MRNWKQDFSKSEQRRLRELTGIAYERELGDALEDLHEEFERWRADEIYPSDLGEKVHEFHQGPSREIFSTYQTLDEDMLVARAVALGLLEREEVESSLLERLERIIAFFG